MGNSVKHSLLIRSKLLLSSLLTSLQKKEETLYRWENPSGDGSVWKRFGDKNNPLLLSVRSGAAISMPGMMDTILNLGLNDEAVEGLASLTRNYRFAWDSYRRFIQMFGDVAMGVPHHLFEEALEDLKRKVARAKGIKNATSLVQEALNKVVPDTALDVDNLKELVARYKQIYKKHTKKDCNHDCNHNHNIVK